MCTLCTLCAYTFGKHLEEWHVVEDEGSIIQGYGRINSLVRKRGLYGWPSRSFSFTGPDCVL